MQGGWYGRWDTERGDVFDVPTKAEAEKLVARGLADHGAVKPENLGKAYDEDHGALQRIMKAERARFDAGHPELQPRPGTGPIYTPRQAVREWSV